MFQRQTYYDLLGIDYNASRAEIREAYDQMKTIYRDDSDMLHHIKLAWATLGNIRSRKAYDKRNHIEQLRRTQRPLDRIPPTLVVDPDSSKMPRTRVIDDKALMGMPQTLVIEEDKGHISLPKTIVADGSAQSLLSGVPLKTEKPTQANPPLVTIDVTLEVKPMSDKSWSQPLSAGDYVVGRSDDTAQQCDICLPDSGQFISRKHASLLVRPEGCFLRDEGSANGTYVNGHLVPMGQMAMVADADRISIEGHVLMVHIQKKSDSTT